MISWLNHPCLSPLLSVVSRQVLQRINNKYRHPHPQKPPKELGEVHIYCGSGTARGVKIIDGALKVCSAQLREAAGAQVE